MKRSTLTLGIFALISVGVTHADVPPSEPSQYSQAYNACMDKASSTTSMVECIGAEHNAQDAKLNAAYKTLMGALSPDRKKQLREAQRAWIAYRDANCEFYFDPDGGTIARLQANQCMLSMTAQRAAELEGFGRLD